MKNIYIVDAGVVTEIPTTKCAINAAHDKINEEDRANECIIVAAKNADDALRLADLHDAGKIGYDNFNLPNGDVVGVIYDGNCHL